jgi:DNA topoisomerase VI subunit B
MNAVLDRTTFTTSRLLDFFSEKELTAQIGHSRDHWPVVILKELVDNAIDACEDVGVAPDVSVVVDDTGITVTDNGPGIPPETIEGMLDYSIRVSSREAYVSPDRGAQGNALKTLVAMPYVMDGSQGYITITACGICHDITVELDRIRQEPRIEHETADDGRNGTSITLHWPNLACSISGETKSRFLQVARDFAFLNPHLTLSMMAFGSVMTFEATDPAWKKWLPSHPTSAHWYTPDHLARLIAGYIGHDTDNGRERTVREFISEFRGLSSTGKQKKVLDILVLSRSPLSVLATDGDMHMLKVASLLDAMKGQSKEPKATALGIIGKDHIWSKLQEYDASAEPDSYDYRRKAYIDKGVPRVVETAFCYLPEMEHRQLITGVNWSPGIINPFRELGSYGSSLDSVLQEARAGADEPIVLFLHMSCPRIRYADRGKSSVILGV